MNTEFLDNTQDQPRRKTLAVITSSMAETMRAEMLSLLTVELADRGWDVTIITHNRQGFFDYLVDERAHRFSMDKAYHKPSERPEILAKFVTDHPEIDHYLFWEPRMKTFASDFEVITGLGKHCFLFFKDCINEAFTNSAAKRRVVNALSLCDGAITGFPLDPFIYGTTYIPYLHPYSDVDYSPAVLGDRELLLLTAGSSPRTTVVVRSFYALLQSDETFRDKVLRIVPIGKMLSAADAEQYALWAEEFPENIVIEELCEKPHKRLDGYAGAILVDNAQEFPNILSVTIAKGLPTLFAKGYRDYEIKGLNKGFRIYNPDDADSTAAELKRFFDPACTNGVSDRIRQAVNADARKEIGDRWEDVLLGKPVAEYEFTSAETALKSAIDYAKHLSNAWMNKFSKATAYNGSGIVKRAKARAAAAKGKGKGYPLTRLGGKIKRGLKRLMQAYKRWERNTFLYRSYIDTDMAMRKKVQLLILKIFIEFDRICKANNLRYYMAGGTLLGAVRHKGFIPWDDDLDVVMPRKDYDKFLKICPPQLREGFVLNAHAYPYTFTRLEVLGPRTTAPLQRKGRNIFVDILPLDCVAPTEKQRLKHGARSDRMRKNMMDTAKMLFPVGFKNWKAVAMRALRKVFCPYPIMIRKWTKNARKYQSDSATHWVCLPGDYGYEGESFPVEYYGNPVYMEFEGITVPVMNNWELYLTAHYGDYMLYPPVSQRSLKHKIYSIDLERYEKMSIEEMAQEVSDDYFLSTGKRVSFLK
ncbi:MAG: LicD family protein [Oscillospiraceae bacterium]|nr:LicD family protein [Oscillospiraceae bacterium]